jgi:hypothetical protein
LRKSALRSSAGVSTSYGNIGRCAPKKLVLYVLPIIGPRTSPSRNYLAVLNDNDASARAEPLVALRNLAGKAHRPRN